MKALFAAACSVLLLIAAPISLLADTSAYEKKVVMVRFSAKKEMLYIVWADGRLEQRELERPAYYKTMFEDYHQQLHGLITEIVNMGYELESHTAIGEDITETEYSELYIFIKE